MKRERGRERNIGLEKKDRDVNENRKVKRNII